MDLKKLSSCMIVFMLVSVGFGMIASDNAQAAFIQPLSNSGLPSTFVAYDTAWNDAGTMAVVVGYDSHATLPQTNAYAYWPHNDTYTPIDNGGYNQQRLQAVDYFKQPIYDWPSVLLVDADFSSDGLIAFYAQIFGDCLAYYDVWQVWQFGDPGSIVKGKPTAEDMAPYDLVVWIPSRNMDGLDVMGDALNSQDTQEIAQYLDGGGNFFLSNTRFSEYHSFGTTGDFTMDYLGIEYPNIMNSNYEQGVVPYPGDAVFDDLPSMWQDWWNYGWTGAPTLTDTLVASFGTICMQCQNGVPAIADTGIRYDSGTFKTIFFGFPLETLYPEDAAPLMQAALDWFCPATVGGTIDQSNEYTGNSGYVDVGNYPSSPWAQSFIPSADHIDAVEFYMYKDSTSGDYFEIEIMQDSGVNSPGATGLAYGYIYSDDVPVGSADWVRCELESGGTNLLPGNTYWIVCNRYNNSATPQNWLVDYNQSYLNGEVQHMSGSWTWLSFDFLFREYSSLTGGGETNSVTLYPEKDNTIYSFDPANSNGAGQYLLGGKDMGGYVTRPLFEFDLSESIPRYSTITSVSLSLYCTDYEDSANYESWLYPVRYEWGEEGSDAPDNEQYGTSAEIGDATWDYRFHNSDLWNIAGGEFGPLSATTWVGMNGWYTWSGNDMIDDVQSWANDPADNHGWTISIDEGMSGSTKWFYSKDSSDPTYHPKLTVTYSDPTITGYEDVFWIAGDYTGMPPATVYKVVPSDNIALQQMNTGSSIPIYAMAVDDMGNPLCAGYSQSYMYYYDGNVWNFIPKDDGMLGSFMFDGLDFNPNDGRFYAVGIDNIFYTDPVPLTTGSYCYRFNHMATSGYDIFSIAWNELYDYGLVAEHHRIMKLWPYGEYGNGTIRYEEVSEMNYDVSYKDISWDSDGWNEAGIVGMSTMYPAYWRYYDSNPQLLEGHIDFGTTGSYRACAFKPPSSPKWLFIPAGSGSVRVNVEEKDQSGEIVVNIHFPHVFDVGMWKQNDPSRLDMLNSQVEADSVYTIAFEGNYTRDGVDSWNNLAIIVTGWFDFGNTGGVSAPADPSWSSPDHRTSQFNISVDPATGMASLLYPVPLAPAGEEFAIHSSWMESGYGPDGSHYRVYVNLTMGSQTAMADGPMSPPLGGYLWDPNIALDDAWTWDLRLWLYDTGSTSARNITYDEFGVQRYAALSVSGSPSASIPPGAIAPLDSPTVIYYSTNAQYKLNVSIPHIYRDGNPMLNFIPAENVQVWNDHPNADGFNSMISGWTQITGPDAQMLIWGTGGTWIQPVGSGTESSGPMYSDYTAATVPEPFEVTEVHWAVEVLVGTPEGTYRATVTITLWS